MRMTFSTPVTPTRDRLTWVDGRRAWTSLPTSIAGSVIRPSDDSGCTARAAFLPARAPELDDWTILACRARQIAQVVVLWPESAACHVVLPPRPAPRGFN